MARQLEAYIFEQQHSVIRFLVAERVNPSEIFSRILTESRKSCINHANTYKWVDRFRCGRKRVGDKIQGGRQIEVSSHSLESRIGGLI